jgi:predicted glycosyltransferase involved in capsule biosynthesis
MINLNIIIPYWDMGCEFRKQNTIICWNEIKKLSSYLKEKGLNVSHYLFEFGKTNNFEDSIKINMELDYFEKSKKINICLNHSINDNINYVAFIDSDCFFTPDQYDTIYNDITLLQENKYYTYNLIDINENQRNNIIKDNSIDYNILKNENKNYSWRHSTGLATLGGFFIAPINELKKIGGFNENFLTWGGEDDEAHTRLNGPCVWDPKTYGPYHLFHPKNENDQKYYIPVYTKEYFEINKINKPT